MRVLIVTGSYPPDVCGTAEYSARLCDALRVIGVDAHVFYRTGWGLGAVPGLLREIDALSPDIVHMQYPTAGYGRKFGPQGIATARRLVTTLHEASQAHILRQVSLLPFLVRSKAIIFTNRYEQRHVARFAPWIGPASSVIPIGCNIPLVSGLGKKPSDTVTCFGIIRPEKGLEDVLAMARELAKIRHSARVQIVGALAPRWTPYFDQLRAQSASLPIDWIIGLSDKELSEVLSQATLAYMPFPDGASERRSSLIAMLMNRACVLTTTGKHTPDDMASAVVPVSSPFEAAAKAAELFDKPYSMAAVAERGAAYAQRFSWDLISRQHLTVYEQCLK